MGLRFRKTGQQDTGGLTEEVSVTITFTAPYSAGGERVEAADVPFRVGARIDSVDFESHPTFAVNFERLSPSAGRMVLYEASADGLTELADGTDLSGVEFPCLVRGR